MKKVYVCDTLEENIEHIQCYGFHSIIVYKGKVLMIFSQILEKKISPGNNCGKFIYK